LSFATSIEKEEAIGADGSWRQKRRKDNSIVLSFIWIFFLLVLFIHTFKDMQGIPEVFDI